MIAFVNPIALITDISLHCSYKFPVMLELRLKKHMNIVMTIMTVKMVSRVFSASFVLSRRSRYDQISYFS